MPTGITSKRETQHKTTPGKRRILLVDENNQDLRLYRMILEDRGFEVCICNSFEDGKQRLESQSFDFIIVGQGSRAFEGRKVIEQAIGIDRRIPVLVITRCIDMGCYLEAMQLGAVDYLEKPLPPDQVVRLADRYSHRFELRAHESTA